MRKISIIFGTRPEAVKLCPIVLEIQNRTELKREVCVTAQHREMLDQALSIFEVKPDVDLNLMRPNQSLAELTSHTIEAVDRYLASSRPDLVLVQGDTTTSACAAIASFYRRIPVGHVEAGLRTGDKYSPFPEEINRAITSQIAALHFAPTTVARAALLASGIADECIFLTGNTVIDALERTVEATRQDNSAIAGLPKSLWNGKMDQRVVLVTGHRRENFGTGIHSICTAIAVLADKFRDVAFVYPVHMNPNVQTPVYEVLEGRPNVHLIAPLDYRNFIRLMARSYIIITDSGGIQEEAPSLGIPVLVTRDTTERPEAIEAGAAILVGTDTEAIIDSATSLLNNNARYREMSTKRNLYGDGKASRRIVDICVKTLSERSRAVQLPVQWRGSTSKPSDHSLEPSMIALRKWNWRSHVHRSH